MNNLNKVFLISNYTFKEIIKSKILVVTVIIGLALMGVTYVATEFTYGVPEKIALDFGLGMLSLSSLGIALFMGCTLLPNELESRTVYMVISRPVSRWVFIAGKILGLFKVLFINFTILATMTLICTKALGGEISPIILWAIFFNLIECLLLLLVVVFFSLLTTVTLSAIISIILLISGHAVEETKLVLFVKLRPILGEILNFYHLVLPGFYKFNLKDFVLYSKTIDSSYILSISCYGISYGVFLIFTIIFIFNKKNLN